MESLYLLIPIAMIFLVVALLVFFWSVRSGQFDDLGSQGRRILFDEPNEIAERERLAARNIANNLDENTDKNKHIKDQGTKND